MLQVGLVGAGFFSQFHIDAWLRLKETKLVSIVETRGEKRKELSRSYPEIAVYEDLRNMLLEQKIDILDIATPPSTHAEILRQVLGELPMVVCQKPFCISLAEAREIAELAAGKEGDLAVHENFRFQPWYRQIKGILESGRLGTVLQANFRFRPGDGAGSSAYLDRQPYFRSMEKFLVHETGIHWIDVFQYLFGPPVEVYADLRQVNPEIAGEDAGFIIFGYETGMRALFDGNRLIDHAAENHRLTMGEFLIEGTEAVLALEGSGRISVRDKGEVETEIIPYDFQPLGFGGDCVYHFQKHIVEYCLGRGPLENSAMDYLKNLVLEDLAYESSESGTRRAVEL